MSIKEAKEILGKEYKDCDEAQIQKWIASANGLTEVFFQTLEHSKQQKVSV